MLLVPEPPYQALLMHVKHCALALAWRDHRPHYLIPNSVIDLETYPTLLARLLQLHRLLIHLSTLKLLTDCDFCQLAHRVLDIC